MPQNTPPDSTLPSTDAAAVDPKEELGIKKAKIQLLEDELSEIDAKLDAEFLEGVAANLTQDEMDMRLDDDIRPFLAMIEDKREAFYREKLTELKGRIDGMKSEVEEQETSMSIEEAKTAFLNAHPECDYKALSEFYHNDVTPRQKEELYAAPSFLEMLELAYAMYTKKNPAPKKEKQTPAAVIPPDFNDDPSSAVKGDPTPVAQDDEYLNRIGLRK